MIRPQALDFARSHSTAARARTLRPRRHEPLAHARVALALLRHFRSLRVATVRLVHDDDGATDLLDADDVTRAHAAATRDRALETKRQDITSCNDFLQDNAENYRTSFQGPANHWPPHGTSLEHDRVSSGFVRLLQLPLAQTTLRDCTPSPHAFEH